MTSWRATSMVTTRRSILTMRSTIGMRKINPGPFVPSSLPRRKITPRSYSRRMRIICGRKIMARTIMGTNQTTNLADSSNMGPLSQVSDLLCRQSFDGYDLYGFSFSHKRIAGRTPIFAFQKTLPPLASIRQRAFTVFPAIVSLQLNRAPKASGFAGHATGQIVQNIDQKITQDNSQITLRDP